MINPGTLPVEDATLETAAANIAVFVAAVRDRGGEVAGDPVRDPAADGDGRYGYLLHTPAGVVPVRMPGAPLSRVRDDLSAAAPCIYVAGNPWWWNDAVGQGVYRGGTARTQ
jgi:hypothetical protein